MNRSRPLAILVVILFAAALAITASSAFASIASDRTATVGVAGDDSALLAIAPHSSTSAQDAFVSDGLFEISVNPTSTTTYAELFNVTNQGSRTVAVWITDVDNEGGGSGDGNEDLIGNDENNTDAITFFNPTFGGAASCENGVESIEDKGNAISLDPGETLVVSMQANSSDVPSDEADLLDSITIHADATVTGQDTSTGDPC